MFRVSRNVLTRVPTSLQHWSWIVPPSGHVADGLKAEDSWLYRLGYEEHILGQTRDWNEEIQSIREMSGKTKSERLTRERAMYKTYSDFLSAAVRGAVSVVDGNMMPINPGECRNTHMYIYNNIFFSLGFDVKEHYLELGGDAAAYVACNHDLKGVRAISEAAVQAEGMEGALYTLGTAIVDYRGYRVACQTIMPGEQYYSYKQLTTLIIQNLKHRYGFSIAKTTISISSVNFFGFLSSMVFQWSLEMTLINATLKACQPMRHFLIKLQ